MKRHQHGYTLTEVVVVLALAPLLVGVIGKLFVSSDGLVKQSRAELLAHEELRRNLEATANVLQGADIDTIGGFDSNGWAANPTFARIIGAGAEGLVTDGAEELRWIPVNEDVDEVAQPGHVVHIRAGTATTVARRVPLGGFRVRLEGGTLRIRLTTYYVTSSRQFAQVTGETAVALRN